MIAMRKISRGQRKTLADFFVNASVAWLGGAVITPFITKNVGYDAVVIVIWGIAMMGSFLATALWLMKGVNT